MGQLPPSHQKIIIAFGFRTLRATIGVIFIAWSLGWLAHAGFSSGFARADDTDKKINEALEPMKADVAEIKASQERTSRDIARLSTAVNLSLRRDLQTRMRDRKREWCSTTGGRRGTLLDEIEALQIEYRALVASPQLPQGYEYRIPDCDDL